MSDNVYTTDSDRRADAAAAYGSMTLVADEGRLRDVAISPPSGVVNWVIHLLAYPCDISVHLDRQGLELLADRIGQALQDADGFCAGPHDPHKRSPGADDEEAPGEVSSTMAPCPACGELYDYGENSGGACTVCLWLMRPGADDEGVDLDDQAMTRGL